MTLSLAMGLAMWAVLQHFQPIEGKWKVPSLVGVVLFYVVIANIDEWIRAAG
jgi:uncharacterized membrane protein